MPLHQQDKQLGTCSEVYQKEEHQWSEGGTEISGWS